MKNIFFENEYFPLFFIFIPAEKTSTFTADI